MKHQAGQYTSSIMNLKSFKTFPFLAGITQHVLRGESSL
jgi:hypothetical protein